VITQVCHQRPESCNPADLVQKHHITLTVSCLQFISVVSVKKNSADAPFVGLTFLFLCLSLREQVVEGVVERLVWTIDDRSPIRDDCKSQRKVTLNI